MDLTNLKAEDIVVIYHADCPDGFCSAWLFHLCYGPKATYIPYKYGKIYPQDVVNKHIFVVDFSFSEDELLLMAVHNKSLTVLDHHKTASHIKQMIADGHIEGQFSLNHSGAYLAGAWLVDGGFEFDSETWDIIDYIQDADLYTWKIEGSKEINAGIRSYPRTFEAWNNLPPVSQLYDAGEHIERYRQQLIEEHLSRKQMTTFSANGINYYVPIVDCSSLNLVSDLGNRLCKGHFFAIIRTPSGLSLRSDETGVDVSEVAKAHGGGGHKHAAGCPDNQL